MYARLGFAVAVNVDPDVLVVDEVLAVGDEAFQRKCLERIKQFQREGRSILLVTHAPDLVRQICDRAAVLDHGELIDIGAPGEAVRSFRHSLLQRGIDLAPEDAEAVRQAKLASQTGAVRFADVVVDYPDPDRGCLLPGDGLRIRVAYDAPKRVDDVVFAMEIYDQDGMRLLGINTDILDTGIDSVEGAGEVVFEFDEVNLNDGTYDIALGVHTHDGGTIYAQREQQDHFQVMNPGLAEGRVHFPMRAFHKRGGAGR
jgi:ABC-2 type transport system ATP-binding protein